jgi:hypothetical protein
MKVDLSKCKVRDKCVTRCGRTVEVTCIEFNKVYPVMFNDGSSRTYKGEWLYGSKDSRDIVSVCKPKRRKVVK